jgi:hypothetical protein
MNTKHTYAALVLFFFLGLTTGIATVMVLQNRGMGPHLGHPPFPPPGRHGPHPANPQHMFEKLKNDLGLQKGQEQRVLEILKEDAKTMEKMHISMREHMDTLIEKLTTVLNPEQAQKLKDIHIKMKKRAFPSPPPHGMLPPPHGMLPPPHR